MSLTCAHRSAAEVCSNTVRRRLLGGNGNGLVKAGIPEAARPGRYPDPEPGARRGPGRSVAPRGGTHRRPIPSKGEWARLAIFHAQPGERLESVDAGPPVEAGSRVSGRSRSVAGSGPIAARETANIGKVAAPENHEPQT